MNKRPNNYAEALEAIKDIEIPYFVGDVENGRFKEHKEPEDARIYLGSKEYLEEEKNK